MNPKEYDITIEELYDGLYEEDLLCANCLLKQCNPKSPECEIEKSRKKDKLKVDILL